MIKKSKLGFELQKQKLIIGLFLISSLMVPDRARALEPECPPEGCIDVVATRLTYERLSSDVDFMSWGGGWSQGYGFEQSFDYLDGDNTTSEVNMCDYGDGIEVPCAPIVVVANVCSNGVETFACEPITVKAQVSELREIDFGNGPLLFRLVIANDGATAFYQYFNIYSGEFIPSDGTLSDRALLRGSLGEVSEKIEESDKEPMGTKTPTTMAGVRG